MATVNYFGTDEREKAKSWDVLMERNRLQARITLLEKEMKQFGAAWVELGHQFSSPRGRAFKADDALSVLNPSQQMCVIASAPSMRFDWEKIRQLVEDHQQTTNALDAASDELRRLGAEQKADF